ncbi:MAG: thioesterase family protein [Acidimicrobiales bacterium]
MQPADLTNDRAPQLQDRAFLFRADGDHLEPTDYVRGPWDHGLQHGGAVCGALGWASHEAVKTTDDSDEFMLCRLTTEILRPVPAARLQYRSSVDHAGRRSRVASASLWHDGRRVAQSSSQWVRVRADATTTRAEETIDELGSGLAVPLRPIQPTDPGASDSGYPRPGFNCDVFEFRCQPGTTEQSGPGVAWVRLKVDLVAGQAPDPVHLLATVSDLGNAVGWEPSLHGEPMVNPDVTLQLFRYPKDEWVCVDSQARSTVAGIGMMETKLWDGDGQFGRVLSTTMESTMPLAAELLPPD